MNNSKTPFLHIENISKSFDGNRVLSNVSLDLYPGDYHALVGENGAGKSTLIRIITGIISHDEGEIAVNGTQYHKMTPALAQKLGIFVVHQELSINPVLSVSENIFLGHELLKGPVRDTQKMDRITGELLADIGLSQIHPDADAGSLSMAERQLVEFCKAVYMKPKLLILDEATSALDSNQVEMMFEKLRALKASGMMIIFISHRLHELYELCDVMTVLKDGKQIVTEEIKDFEQDRLVTLMTGRKIVDLFPPKRLKEEVAKAPVILSAENISFGKCNNISFVLRRGEILGIGGLQGQGQQEILECLFGMKRVKSGRLVYEGKEVKFNHARDAMKKQIAYLPAERKTESLFVTHPIRFNMSFASLDKLSNLFGLINSQKESRQIDDTIKEFSIKLSSVSQLVSELSGGNQQKVVLGKWLCREPKLLLLNEPTRGIDVGTKKEIYELLHKLALQGMSIMLISSDTLELVGICDRVLTVYENSINGELYSDELNEESLVKASVFGKGSL